MTDADAALAGACRTNRSAPGAADSIEPQRI